MKLLNSLSSLKNNLLQSAKGLWDRFSDNNKNYIIIALLVSLYIGFGYRYIDYEYYYYAIIPVALLGLLLLYYRIDIFLGLIAFCIPFSVNRLITETASMSLPSEPLLMLFAFAFIIKFFVEKIYDMRVLKHPIALTMGFYLLWMFITSITSVQPLVSFKYFLSKFFFIIPFFIAIIPIIKNFKKIKSFYYCYAISLAIVVIYSTVGFALKGFDFQYSFYIMQPFYNDHTAYGAIVALFIPITFYFMIEKGISTKERVFLIILFAILFTGLMLSYSRAAWLSILPAVMLYVVLRLRIKFKYIFSVVGGLLLIFILFQGTILQQLQQNTQDSSGDVMEHLTSISNITTDASNMERINRWACAFRMFEEKPIFGFGPGAYQFEYSAYQKIAQRSVISTNAANLGSVHSEYFGPMAESGVLGIVSVLTLFITVICIGIRVYRKALDKNHANLCIFLTMSLITYYTHAVLNNFLETDKLSVPFWFFTAGILAIDLYTKKADKIIR